MNKETNEKLNKSIRKIADDYDLESIVFAYVSNQGTKVLTISDGLQNLCFLKEIINVNISNLVADAEEK